ncbi:dihydropteroate synthase [Granulosicoccus antarcticus]|nr:dihydropteroate synthase [Granulosicoccus antarcticus]
MGILNVTPDSFSDGGRFDTLDKALAQVESMLSAGADIIDIGGESTRPGAAAVSEQQEMDRVLPVIEAISNRFDTIVSLDTSRPTLMREGAAVGVGMINDVRALCMPGALAAAAATGLPVCLMHMKGEPRTMQQEPVYADVLVEVGQFLAERRQVCIAGGVAESSIVLDPGFGFGKTLKHNLTLLKYLSRLGNGSPLLTGLSRKRMFAQILGSDSVDRVTASVSAALLCVQNGASIVRVHDVAPTVQALAVYRAVQEC